MKVDQEKIRVGAEKINAQRLWRCNISKDVKPARFFDYVVVIDFEATCIGRDNDEFCQEIIQFPAVIVDVKTMTIKDEFCEYVKPVVNPKLSDYCTNLTGITQDLVDNAMEFDEVLQRFQEWLISHELGSVYKFTLCCDGSYDIGKFLYKQCQLSNVKFPIWAHRWMNIRKSFCLFYHLRWFNLRLMVEMLGQEFQGRPHNGSDDALNISKVVICLLQDGSEALENERILLDEEEQEKNANEISKDPRIWFGLATVSNLNRGEFLSFYKSQHGIPKHCKSAFSNHHHHQHADSPYSNNNNNNNNNNYMGKENMNSSSMNIMDYTLGNSPPKHDFFQMYPPCGSSHNMPACMHGMVPNLPGGRLCIHCRMPTDAHHHQPPFPFPPHQLYLPQVHFHSRGGDSSRIQNSRTHLSDYMNVSGQEQLQFSPPPARVKRPLSLIHI